MSTPMHEMPDHMLIAVNTEGNGPETDAALVAGYRCWCGDPDCKEN